MPVPFSAPHDQITSNALAQLMGKMGVPTFLAAGGTTSVSAGNYCAVLFTADTVLSAIKFWDNGLGDINANGTAVASMTFPKGAYFAANIHSLTVSSGQCIVFPA